MYTPREPVEIPLFAQDSAFFRTEKIECTHMALVFGHFLPHKVTSRHFGRFYTAPHLPPFIWQKKMSLLVLLQLMDLMR